MKYKQVSGDICKENGKWVRWSNAFRYNPDFDTLYMVCGLSVVKFTRAVTTTLYVGDGSGREVQEQ